MGYPFILALLLSSAGLASAQVMDEAGLYRRCYMHITGQPVPFKSPVIVQINQGQTTAIAACEALLNKGDLASNGVLKTSDDRVSRAILRNFQNFHRSWFSAGVVEDIQGYDNEIAKGTTDVYDTTEPALALTRSLFDSQGKYSEVLTRAHGWTPVRVEEEAVRARIGWNVTFPGRRIFANNAGLNQNLFSFRDLQGRAFSGGANSIVMQMPAIQVGELIGIVGTTNEFQVPNLSLNPLGADRPGNREAGLKYAFDFFDHHGGGIIGMPVFYLLNYGHDLGVKSNATSKVPRRWAQSAMQSLMCASLPALRESDIRSLVMPTSSTPFRNSSSCVMCHATLDQMGYTARNFVTGSSDFFTFEDKKQTLLVAKYHEDMGEVQGWPAEPVANFHRTKPTGKLFYRSYTGELVNKSVVGVQGLGVAMSQTDDFYACAAKRYFEFFTGMDVPLFDRTDPNNAQLNKKLVGENLEARLFVEKLGQSLKSHQSLKQLIKEIIRSDYYKQVNLRLETGK